MLAAQQRRRGVLASAPSPAPAKAPPATRLCEYCGEPFTPSHHGGVPQSYCSARCRGKASKERLAAVAPAPAEAEPAPTSIAAARPDPEPVTKPERPFRTPTFTPESPEKRALLESVSRLPWEEASP
jgi:hypothetical protein